jgi:prepilin-type N-terminal cleavage/methylation domain-containing protein
MNSDRRAGFTLLEALIALAVVTMAVTMLARVHVQTLRAERMSQLVDGARLRMETVVSEVLLGVDPRAIVGGSPSDGWVIRSEFGGGGPGSTAWQTWTVAASNSPSAAVVVYLRPRGVNP